jgi:hypothetical protein
VLFCQSRTTRPMRSPPTSSVAADVSSGDGDSRKDGTGALVLAGAGEAVGVSPLNLAACDGMLRLTKGGRFDGAGGLMMTCSSVGMVAVGTTAIIGRRINRDTRGDGEGCTAAVAIIICRGPAGDSR